MSTDIGDIIQAIREASGGSSRRGKARRRTFQRGRPHFVVNRASGRILGFGLDLRRTRAWMRANEVPGGLVEVIRDFEEFVELFMQDEAALILERLGVGMDFVGMDNVVHAWAWEGLHRTAKPLGAYVLDLPKGTPWVMTREVADFIPGTFGQKEQ